MDYKLKMVFMNKPSKEIEIKDVSHNSTAIREAMNHLNSYEEKELIGVVIKYIGESVDIKF